MDKIKNKTIDLFKTQEGWFATFYDDRDNNDMPRTTQTKFTIHTKASVVERAIADKNPDYLIYVIGG